jgi:hypothetical protein
MQPSLFIFPWEFLGRYAGRQVPLAWVQRFFVRQGGCVAGVWPVVLAFGAEAAGVEDALYEAD